MSLWTTLTGAVKSAASAITKVPGLATVAKAIPGLGTAATVASVVGAVSSAGRVGVKTAARVIPGKGLVQKAATVGAVTTAYQVGQSTSPVYDQAGNLVGYTQRRRRMNYGNVKAAKRAGRRIRGTIKLLHNLEKSLPHKVVHRRSK